MVFGETQFTNIRVRSVGLARVLPVGRGTEAGQRLSTFDERFGDQGSKPIGSNAVHLTRN
jgi:hypothetical protein